jgi:hypothetical protein
MQGRGGKSGRTSAGAGSTAATSLRARLKELEAAEASRRAAAAAGFLLGVRNANAKGVFVLIEGEGLRLPLFHGALTEVNTNAATKG